MTHDHRYFEVDQHGVLVQVPKDCAHQEWQLLELVQGAQSVLDSEKLSIQLLMRERGGDFGCRPELVISAEDIEDIVLVPSMNSGWSASAWPPRLLGDDAEIMRLSSRVYGMFLSPVALALQAVWAVNEMTQATNGESVPSSESGKKIFDYADDIRALGGPFDVPTQELREVMWTVWAERSESRYHAWYYDSDQ